MRTEVTFLSKMFWPYEGEWELYLSWWGKALAEYMTDRLNALGIETEPIRGNYLGWYIPVKNKGFRLRIHCRHHTPRNGECEDEEFAFLCYVNVGMPTIRYWFKRLTRANRIRQLTSAVAEILSSEPGIRHVCLAFKEK